MLFCAHTKAFVGLRTGGTKVLGLGLFSVRFHGEDGDLTVSQVAAR